MTAGDSSGADLSPVLAESENDAEMAKRGLTGLIPALLYSLGCTAVLLWPTLGTPAGGPELWAILWGELVAPCWLVTAGLRDGTVRLKGCGLVAFLLVAPIAYYIIVFNIVNLLSGGSEKAGIAMNVCLMALPALGLLRYVGRLLRAHRLRREALRCPAREKGHDWEPVFGTVVWYTTADGTRLTGKDALRAHLQANPALATAPVVTWQAKAVIARRCRACGAILTSELPEVVSGSEGRVGVSVGMTGID